MRSNPLLVPRPLVLRWSGNEPMHLLWRTLHRLRAPGWRGCRLLSSGRSGMDIIYDKMKVQLPLCQLPPCITPQFHCVLQATGPVTVAEYMRECLLHPVFVSTALSIAYMNGSPLLRGTTCRKMCLVKRVTLLLHLKSAKFLERYICICMPHTYYTHPPPPLPQLVAVWVLADWKASGYT